MLAFVFKSLEYALLASSNSERNRYRYETQREVLEELQKANLVKDLKKNSPEKEIFRKRIAQTH